MTNPNCYFCALLELTEVMGYPVKVMSPKIGFLKGDSLKMRAHFRQTGGDTLNTSGLSITMKMGAAEIEGVAYSHVEGKWDFAISKEVTDALGASVQDVSFILTRTATSESTFVRIHEAIQPVSVA